MTKIRVATVVRAPRERCFDLARSIEAHLASTSETGERAVEGVTTALIGLGESVTWEATHFGIRQRLTSTITAYDRPHYFQDEMTEAAFDYFAHDHLFENENGFVTMTDVVRFSAPMGLLGRFAERLVLAAYLKRFVSKRGQAIKRMAESDEWREFLPGA